MLPFGLVATGHLVYKLWIDGVFRVCHTRSKSRYAPSSSHYTFPQKGKGRQEKYLAMSSSSAGLVYLLYLSNYIDSLRLLHTQILITPLKI